MINLPLIFASFVLTFLGFVYFYYKGKNTDNSHKKRGKKSTAAMRAFSKFNPSDSKSIRS